MKGITLRELADRVGGEILGDDTQVIRGVAPIESAKPGDITFLANPSYSRYVEGCQASALIANKGTDVPFRPLLFADNPYHLFAKVVEIFHERPRPVSEGIDPQAVIDPGAVVAKDCTIMTGAVVEAGVSIGSGSILYPGVIVRRNSRLGEGCTLHPRVLVESDSILGNKVILHGGTIIGEPGDLDVEHPKTPSATPGVEIGDDVELGSNVTVCRGRSRTTRIGQGAKMDNLVHVDSGAHIGKHCLIVAQARVGENATIEDMVTVAGQCSIEPGVTLGSRVVVAARSVVTSDVPSGSVVSGAPARPHAEEKRIVACLSMLPTLFQKVRNLERKLHHTENGQ
jgi:UDP-3-O-[3-hydroxymyristoyl] glucosamine N-acyltransferase